MRSEKNADGTRDQSQTVAPEVRAEEVGKGKDGHKGSTESLGGSNEVDRTGAASCSTMVEMGLREALLHFRERFAVPACRTDSMAQV